MNNRFIEAIARRIAETTPEFKWLKDFFSTTIQRNANVITRGTNTSQGNLAEWGANGDLTDSGHSTNQDLETTSDVKFRSVEAARIDVNRNLTFKRENTAGTTSSAKSGIMLTGLTSPMIDVPSGADFGFIDSQYFKDGAIIFLKFNGNSTITHKENGSEADNIRLNYAENHTFTNRDVLTLQYDDVVEEWREIGRTSGKPVNSDFVGTTDTQTLTNKSVEDNNFKIINESDNSKEAKIDVSGIPTNTTRTYSLPDGASITDPIITEYATQTLRGKTLFNTTLNDADFNDSGGSAAEVDFGTNNGTKLGTSTSQLLAFYNQTPTSQPSSTGETSGFTSGSGTTVNDDSTFTGNVGSTAYTVSDIVKHLKNLGLIAE